MDPPIHAEYFRSGGATTLTFIVVVVVGGGDGDGEVVRYSDEEWSSRMVKMDDVEEW